MVTVSRGVTYALLARIIFQRFYHLFVGYQSYHVISSIFQSYFYSSKAHYNIEKTIQV